MGETVQGALLSVAMQTDAAYTVVFRCDGDEGNERWMTVLRKDYPADLWPPRAGDRVSVTVPRVVRVGQRYTPSGERA